MKSILPAGAFLLSLAASSTAVEFRKEILPILENNCIDCHRDGKEKGDVNLEPEKIARHIGSGRIIQPGKGSEGLFMKLILSEDPDNRMPPKGSRLSEDEVQKLKVWIARGAELEPEPDPDAPDPLEGDWTNAEGKTIEAALLRVEGGNAILRLKDGREVPYPIEKLSGESQAVVREFAERAR